MLDKAIKYGKEKRKPYRKSKVFDSSCRNHGGCPWCESNRTFFDKKKRVQVELDYKEYIMSGWCKYEIQCTECDWKAELGHDNIPHCCPHCMGEIKKEKK